MIEDPAIRKAREDVRDAPVDKHGCIRIRRDDVLDMLDVIVAMSEALGAAKAAPPHRFADRIRARGVPVKPKRLA